MLKIGIDAFNIKQGGGLTHLSLLLNNASPESYGISKVTLWISRSAGKRINPKPWLKIISPNWMSKNLLYRIWRRRLISQEFVKEKCNLVFFPGGILSLRLNNIDISTVVLSQNLLPFEPLQSKLFGSISLLRLKMLILATFQKKSFKSADGIIFLTNYAMNTIERVTSSNFTHKVLIPHGIEKRFFCLPRVQKPINFFNVSRPFKLLYVSIFLPYKHQIELSRAVKKLRDGGLPVEITFIGKINSSFGDKFRVQLKEIDPQAKFIKFFDEIPFSNLHKFYRNADLFVFASSCENLPNILLEAMASGLPIASSFYGPMPEILGKGGVYFDPFSEKSIFRSLKSIIINKKKRRQISNIAYEKASAYSWKNCANSTFSFLQRIANAN